MIQRAVKQSLQLSRYQKTPLETVLSLSPLITYFDLSRGLGADCSLENIRACEKYVMGGRGRQFFIFVLLQASRR